MRIQTLNKVGRVQQYGSLCRGNLGTECALAYALKMHLPCNLDLKSELNIVGFLNSIDSEFIYAYIY